MQAVLAVASPVTGDQVTLTNHPWTFSVEALRQQFGLRRLQVVNDFAANAVAVPHLGENDVFKSAAASRSAERADRRHRSWHRAWRERVVAVWRTAARSIAGEGGHVTMAPATPQESAILDLMR